MLKCFRLAGFMFLLGAAIALTVSGTRAQQPKTPPTDPKAKPKLPTPKELYGEQGGEKVSPANARLPNSVMRARLEDTFIKLSNPRIGETSGKTKRKAMLVDYEVVSKGKLNGGSLVLHTEDGGRAEVQLNSIVDRDDGTIELVGVKQFGNIKIAANATFPDNVEMYVVRSDDRYDPPMKWMVSNSVVMGKIKVTTKPRDWTTEEIERFVKGPPAYKNPNAFPDIGEDVPQLPKAGGQFRFLDPDGNLLGLDFSMGEWEKKKVVARMTPIFTQDQPKQHSTRVIAKKGYAVCGAELNLDKFVCGIRFQFAKLKPDGTLDMKDTYTADWAGEKPTGETTKAGNDGRRVLGIILQQGAIVDRFSLVMESEKKKE